MPSLKGDVIVIMLPFEARVKIISIYTTSVPTPLRTILIMEQLYVVLLLERSSPFLAQAIALLLQSVVLLLVQK